MVRVVSQETFEAAVKENIEEFGLSATEAIEDAVQQFQAQGVDLSNIIKDLILSESDSEKHIVANTLKHINEIMNDESKILDLIGDLDVLKMECDKDIAHKLMASKEGAYKTIINCLDKYEANQDVTLTSLNTIVSLMDGQPDILEKDGIAIMNRYLDQQMDDDIVIRTLRWISVCCLKHEDNRQKIFNAAILTHLKKMIEKHKDPRILTELCLVLRHLVLDDDIRVEYGQAHEHARLIATETLHILTQMLSDFKSDETFIADILLTIASLVVRNEFCQQVDEAGGLQFILDVMIEFYENESIIRQCFKLLKALAGNDDVKRNVIKKGGAPILCGALDKHKDALHSAINGLGCISAVALREKENSKALFEAGIPEVIMQCMNIHKTNLNVQRNGSWAIRNIVCRFPEHCSKFLEFDAEAILNEALSRFERQASHDIKSALKDLGCNVKLEEQWTGKGGRIHTCEKYNETTM